MRQQNALKTAAVPDKQQGFALFVVLMIMIVVAFLVVVAAQSYNTEQRISTNDADRKQALSLAEAALREGELHILDLEDRGVVFNADCDQGLCAAPNTATYGNITVIGNPTEEAWKRSCKPRNELCIDSKGREYGKKMTDISKNPRYIIEYLGTDTKNDKTIYRVTAKAWGKNANTVVILQSYVSNE